MSPSIPRATALLSLLFLGGGCVPPYLPPTASEPHAVLKIRRTYEITPGTRLDEACEVNGHVALETSSASQVAQAPRADAILIRPQPLRVSLRGAFWHQELRTVPETYYVQVSYTEFETYSCGSGTSFRTCTRSVMRFRSEPRTRMVTRYVDVSDGSCGRRVLVSPAVGAVYLLDFTYRDSGVCSAACVEQVASDVEGEFQTRPCPIPSAQEARDLE